MRHLPRVLTATGAQRIGMSDAAVRTELRRGRWIRLATGIYLTRPDEPTRADWAQVGMALGGPTAVLSGWDAVRLRGLGTAWAAAESVLMLTAPGQRNRLVGGVHLRPTRRLVLPSSISVNDDVWGGVRIAPAARAVADTALSYRQFAHVRAMVTGAIQRELCTVDELVSELGSGPRNGSALLRRALADLAQDVHSIAEAEAVELLRAVNVPAFVVNAPIRDAHGRLLYRVDILWPELRAIVEIDSREFHFTEADWKATMHRHNVLTGMGFAVRHYAPSMIRVAGLGWAQEVADWLHVLAKSLVAAH